MKRILYMVILALVSKGIAAQVISNGMVAYYPFNGNANDESGNGNHGTVLGATLTTDRFGNANKAYFFDGSNKITAPDLAMPSGNASRTVSLWVYSNGRQTMINSGNAGHLFGYGTNGTNNAYYDLALWGNVFRVSNWSNPPDIDLVYDHPVKEWFHVVVTLDNTKDVRVYINGALAYVSDVETWNTQKTGLLYIGEFLNQGKLDDIRVYDRGLCENEVRQLYNAEVSASNVNLSNGLVAHYPMDGNGNDVSGNAYHAINVGATNAADRFGTANSAMYFNGTSSHMDGGSPVPPLLQLTDEVSVSAWIKVDAVGDGGRIVRVGCNCAGGTGYDFYSLPYGSGYHLAALFGNYGGGAAYVLANQTFNFGEWYHVVFTGSRSGLRMFRNGEVIAVGPGPIDPPSAAAYNGFPFYIGRKDNNGYQQGVMDDIRIYNRVLNSAEIAALAGPFFNYTCVSWDAPAPVLDKESAKAFDLLCSKSVIQKDQQVAAINNTLRKDELAKILYKALYDPNPNAGNPVLDAPNPFIDLQPSFTSYVKEAKALSYLEYGDGISVFKRQLTHFRPQFPIARKYVIKAMLETFNIKPYTSANAPTPTCWYGDVPMGSEMYYYILKAREMGFIKQQTSFNPDAPITRKEAFVILYRILRYFETTAKPVPTADDYFIPSNISTANFARSLGISDGNFNSYTKTSFGIAGLMPLSFAHSYNSALTELPDSSYNIIEPLGKGWTHNYNCYLQRVTDDVDDNERYVISWGDGTMNSFILDAGVYKPETVGLYATLTASAGQASFTYLTKSQVRYVFTKQLLSNRTIWVLTSVTDRNNNALTLTWTPFPVGAPTTTRLFRVTDPAGRYLQFSYHAADPSKVITVTAVTGSITRSISYSYTNDNTDLSTYTDLRGNVTSYSYEDPTDPNKDHLLKQIRLPKGNVVDNTYEQRKLKSSQMAGQYLTNVNLSQNYDAGNNTNFSEANISTTRNGNTINTNVQQDQLGNVRRGIGPTGDLSLLYSDPTHPTRPTGFSNSINHMGADTRYDAMGNVTSVTKTGGGFAIKDSFTYNNFNDILTYINGRGYKTTFTYNANGNLTSITDALGNVTQMNVNSNGTVAKVTNPEGIYTDLSYDIFGNTVQSKLQNAIISSATYDDASRLVQKTDPNGVVTSIEYESNDLVKRVVADPNGLNNAISYHYDANDNLDTIVNPKGVKTALKYNDWDQMVEYRFANFTKTYVYNEDGTLKTFTDQKGTVFNHTYNSDGTLQSDGYANYGYDAEFNLQTIQSIANNKVIGFGYDELKRTRKVSYNDFAADSVVYSYDANNNVTAMRYPGGFKVGYEYDPLDRLIRVYNFSNGNDFARYTYYNDGRLKTQTNGNGTRTTYGYDGFGRLDSIANRTSGDSNICSYKFRLESVGNHVAETAYGPSIPLAPSLMNEAIPYVHDDANRMLSRDTTNFNYDANGNHTSATGQWNSTYTYDSKDNLLTSSTPSLNCEYDGLENRRRRNDTLFVLDILGGSNVLMETDVNGTPIAYYIHGLGLICRLNAAQADPHYYHYDYRGSTTAITNNAQNVTHSYSYGAFGETIGANESGFMNRYRFVGKYGVQYEDSSLYFMRARYYNPMKGRFLGEDPVWGTNLFAYGSNNAVGYIDANGNKGSKPNPKYNTKECICNVELSGFNISTGMQNATILGREIASVNIFKETEIPGAEWSTYRIDKSDKSSDHYSLQLSRSNSVEQSEEYSISVNGSFKASANLVGVLEASIGIEAQAGLSKAISSDISSVASVTYERKISMWEKVKPVLVSLVKAKTYDACDNDNKSNFYRNYFDKIIGIKWRSETLPKSERPK